MWFTELDETKLKGFMKDVTKGFVNVLTFKVLAFQKSIYLWLNVTHGYHMSEVCQVCNKS